MSSSDRFPPKTNRGRKKRRNKTTFQPMDATHTAQDPRASSRDEVQQQGERPTSPVQAHGPPMVTQKATDCGWTRNPLLAPRTETRVETRRSVGIYVGEANHSLGILRWCGISMFRSRWHSGSESGEKKLPRTQEFQGPFSSCQSQKKTHCTSKI